MNQSSAPPQRLGIAGLGTIGRKLASVLDSESLEGFTLAGVAAHDHAKAKHWMREHLSRPVDCLDFDALAQASDWVVECAPALLLREIAEPALRRGRRLVVLSAGALVDLPHLIDLAREIGRAHV